VRHKGRHQRTVLTAVGPLAVERVYFACAACGQGDFGADRILGIDGYLTASARRLACLAGARESFAKAQSLLAELAGWRLDDEAIRQLCHAEAARARDWQAQQAPAAERLARAAGSWEVQIDAGKVNTDAGWRDVKVAVFARRPAGKPAEAATWDERQLPRPTARRALAAVEEAQAFGPRCRAEAERLGLPDSRAVSVLGDGAEWVWNLAQEQFPQARQCLDIYHAAEHIAAAAKKVFGEGAAEARSQAQLGRDKLLADGYCGVVEWVGELIGAMPAGGDGAALGEMLNYLAGHQGRLQYASRLRRGEAIGSGLVEGSIKQLVNKRLKRTGARWTVEHVGPFVELCALTDSPEWNAFWGQN
jgi:hypothetical protein